MVARRFRSLIGLAVARVVGRLRIAPQRVVLSVAGVALAIGLMVAVSGVSLGLASESVVQSEDVDYWIIPEQANVESIAISTGGPRLGDVHATSSDLNSDSRIDYATPVLLELVPVNDDTTGDRTYVLAVGIIPAPEQEVLGLPTGTLTPGDPHYQDGSYEGEWTNEAVLNDAAATLTNTSTGERLAITNQNRSMTVTNVSEGGSNMAAGSVPVMVVHLSELQTLTRSADGDTADQLLVSTSDQSVRNSLEGRYPQTTVVSKGGLSAQQVSTSNLPLAVAVAALVSALLVGILFITTLMGLEVSADRQQLAALAAIGFSNRSRSMVVAIETVVISILGGMLGIGIGILGIAGANRLGARLFGTDVVAIFDVRLAGYALIIAVIIGIVGAIYPVWLSRRGNTLEALS